MPSWPDDADPLFDPAETEPALDLGAVARAFWRLPGVLRTDHVQAFAARGLNYVMDTYLPEKLSKPKEMLP